MYQYFQKIVAVYESEPNNYTRLMELMQDMQECGQPPAEIVRNESRLLGHKALVFLLANQIMFLLTALFIFHPPHSLRRLELAPGLEFGPNGMPLMANMGPGVPMPAIPGMPAFPQGGGKPGECSVM